MYDKLTACRSLTESTSCQLVVHFRRNRNDESAFEDSFEKSLAFSIADNSVSRFSYRSPGYTPDPGAEFRTLQGRIDHSSRPTQRHNQQKYLWTLRRTPGAMYLRRDMGW